ncbi:MAG: hypothetical protein ACRDY2_08200 [Acidimicrobiales bacterium]
MSLVIFAGICAGLVAGVGIWAVMHIQTTHWVPARWSKLGLVAIAGGVVVALASGWVALGVITALTLALCLPELSAARAAARRPATLEALATWVESIRSELAASANWRAALARANVPATLRSIAAKEMGLEAALALTEAVGGTEAALVGMALRLAASASVARASHVLGDAATAMRRRATAQRAVAATRRTSQVAALGAAGVAVAGLVFAARTVLPEVGAHVYSGAGGQLVLGLLCLPLMGGLVILSRSARPL